MLILYVHLFKLNLLQIYRNIYKIKYSIVYLYKINPYSDHAAFAKALLYLKTQSPFIRKNTWSL